MHPSQTQTGHIVRYDREAHYGFIETAEKEVAFFYFDKSMQRQFVRAGGDPRHQFSSGDEIQFNVLKSAKDPSKWEAFNLKFVGNSRREQLLAEATENSILKGYIKKISTGKLMVKHVSTYVYLPIQISDWELELEKNYEQRIDQLVEFSLNQTTDVYRLKAVLADATYTPEFLQLSQFQHEQAVLDAALAGKNEDGYFATLLDGKVEAFILIPKELTDIQRELLSGLRKGSTLPVRIKRIYDNKRVSLVLAT